MIRAVPVMMVTAPIGRAEIDNNAAERSLRTVALGRRSYLFAGSEYGLIGSCKLNKIDPENHLRYAFERIADQSDR